MVEEDEETPVDEPTPLLETEEVGCVDLGRGERGRCIQLRQDNIRRGI